MFDAVLFVKYNQTCYGAHFAYHFLLPFFMGQIASLFGLNEQDFHNLNASPTSFDFSQPHLVSVGFNKTFEGLRFVLSKGQDAETTALIGQIFNPWSFIGEEIDYDNVNWEQDSPFEAAQPIYYNPPETVDAIAAFLATVTEDKFRQAFDPNELNQAKIYPSGAWNKNTNVNQGFNETDLVEELRLLQNFFSQIQNSGYYCVCFIN